MQYPTRRREGLVPFALLLVVLPAAGPLQTMPDPAALNPVAADVVASLPSFQPSPQSQASHPQASTGPVRTLTARSGDTLGQMLTAAGVERAEAEPALAALEGVFPARQLRPGHAVTLRQDATRNAALLAMELEPQPGRTLVVSRTTGGWVAEENAAPAHRHLVLAKGRVSGGLFESLKAAGLPAALALGMIRTLSHEIDFQRDLQPDDRFTVLFERFRDPEGDLLRNGGVVHAEFLVSGRRLSIWRHETAAGAEWYDDSGRALRQGFLRTPLDGARVTSAFGPRRHPVLGFNRVHQGIDFAAPTGTPVYAAADGVVASLGTTRGYGRIIRLRHADGIETGYAHLSAFGANLQVGTRVAQGDVIGRVGSSGLSTGPHLHYEVVAGGRQVDPVTLPADTATRLAGTALEAFQASRRTLQASLARLEPMQEVAAAD